MTRAPVWTGDYVRSALGIEVTTDGLRSLVPVEALVGVALRQNPKRAHLLVSTVLAKHMPTVPGLSIVAGELLGLLVAAELDGGPAPAALYGRLAGVLREMTAARGAGERAKDDGGVGPATPGERDAACRRDLEELRRDVAGWAGPGHPEVVTLGYAETATGLGHLVAGTIGSYYLHSTRHAPQGGRAFAGFEEEHSHATAHRLYPTDDGWLKPGGTVVLVDDELSTGTTIINTITALQATVPQRRWIVASLIDLRSPDDRSRFHDLAAVLDCTIAVVTLGTGSIDLPADVAARAGALLADLDAATDTAPDSPAPVISVTPGAPGAPVMPVAPGGLVTPVTPGAPVTPGGPVTPPAGAASPGPVRLLDVECVPVRSARFGVTGRIDSALAEQIAAAIRPHLPPPRPDAAQEVVVLGSEEFIALPLAVADHLDHALLSSGTPAGGGRSILPATATAHPPAGGREDPLAGDPAHPADGGRNIPPATATAHPAARGRDIPLAAATAHPAARGRNIPPAVRFSTTTRSPIAAIDRPDYAIGSTLTFQSHDLTPDGVGARFAYNLTRDGRRPDTIVFLPEPGTPPDRMLAPDGIVEALRRVTDGVIVVQLPEAVPSPIDWTSPS